MQWRTDVNRDLIIHKSPSDKPLTYCTYNAHIFNNKNREKLTQVRVA